MANTIVQSVKQSIVVQKSENQDTVARNWSFEIWKLVAGSDNDATTEAITSNLTTPMFATMCVDTVDTGGIVAAYPIAITISGKTVTPAWATAPTSSTYYLKIEGWA